MLFDASPLPMWVYDAETLRFLAVNDAAIRHYGYSREEFLAMTLKDIRPPAEVPRMLADVAEAGSPRPGTWQHRRRDGSIIDVEITAGGSSSRAGARRSSSPTTSVSASGSSAASPTRRRWRRSGASPAASRTTSTTS